MTANHGGFRAGEPGVDGCLAENDRTSGPGQPDRALGSEGCEASCMALWSPKGDCVDWENKPGPQEFTDCALAFCAGTNDCYADCAAAPTSCEELLQMSTGEGCAADCSDTVLTAYAKSTGFMNADNDITCDVWPATAPGQCSPGLSWEPKDESMTCRICEAASKVACEACDADPSCNGEGCQMDACNLNGCEPEVGASEYR